MWCLSTINHIYILNAKKDSFQNSVDYRDIDMTQLLISERIQTRPLHRVWGDEGRAPACVRTYTDESGTKSVASFSVIDSCRLDPERVGCGRGRIALSSMPTRTAWQSLHLHPSLRQLKLTRVRSPGLSSVMRRLLQQSDGSLLNRTPAFKLGLYELQTRESMKSGLIKCCFTDFRAWVKILLKQMHVLFFQHVEVSFNLFMYFFWFYFQGQGMCLA